LTILITLAAVAPAVAEPVRLTLKEAVRMAAEKNLDVRAELYTTAQIVADINRNLAIYDPQFNALANYSNSTTPVPGLVGTVSSEGRVLQLDSSISKLLWTGATASVGFNNRYTNSNSAATPVNYWQSSLGVTLSQPLLKNFGRENTEFGINVSRLSKYASIEHFKTSLLNTVSQVRSQYFKLFSLREQLEVRKVSLELSRRILSDTRARVAAGVLPAMEILNAEFGVTSREKELIDAEKAVRDQVDALHLLLQMDDRRDIETVDLPSREVLQINQDQALKVAMSRPDILEQKRNLEIHELETRVLTNRTRPDLSLNLSGALVGHDRTYPGDLERIGSADYPAWGIGMTFSYPLGNGAAENDYRKSRLRAQQTVLQIRSIEEAAATDVRSAIRSVESWYKQIEVADRGRAFAEERLRAFLRKSEVGLATTKDVLDVEADLAAAKSNQISALANYANAVTDFWRVTGELLEREGIRVVESDADKLYSDIR
jgi:outer membrane protein TolC